MLSVIASWTILRIESPIFDLVDPTNESITLEILSSWLTTAVSTFITSHLAVIIPTNPIKLAKAFHDIHFWIIISNLKGEVGCDREPKSHKKVRHQLQSYLWWDNKHLHQVSKWILIQFIITCLSESFTFFSTSIQQTSLPILLTCNLYDNVHNP